jgi:hypothetical protein
MTFSERGSKILISDQSYSVHGDRHVSILFIDETESNTRLIFCIHRVPIHRC